MGGIDKISEKLSLQGAPSAAGNALEGLWLETRLGMLCKRRCVLARNNACVVWFFSEFRETLRCSLFLSHFGPKTKEAIHEVLLPFHLSF